MAEDQSFSTLPPDAPTPWLARNRKIAILLGLVVVLGGAAIFTLRNPRSTNVNTSANVTSNSAVNASAAIPGRPTFQRSTITNTTTTLPPAYRPPTTDDLRKAITNLNSSTTPKP